MSNYNKGQGSRGPMPPSDRPPAYSAPGHEEYPMTHQHQSSAAVAAAMATISALTATPLDFLQQILGHIEQFYFYQPEAISAASNTIVVVIKDHKGQSILSALCDPPRQVQQGNVIVHYTGFVRFTDANGRLLIVARENGRVLSISSGDVILGNIEGFGVFVSDISVVNAMGERLFWEEKDKMDKKVHKFVQANGQEIGRVTETLEGNISMNFQARLDVRTKALIIACAHNLFLRKFATTAGCCGCSIL